jgi:branched-chain amino acid aminotransferase
MAVVVNIGGELHPPERAAVGVFDRGFLYGDSVYETLRTYGGKVFELERHLERLRRSAASIFMRVPWDDARLRAEVERTVGEGGNAESYVRIVVTRGTGKFGLDPHNADEPLPIVIVRPLEPPPPEAYATGIALAVVGVRRNLRDALDPAAKTGNYLNSVLALREAREAGAFEAILLDAEGHVTECASANIFCVRGGFLLTPPLSVGILDGVTRALVLELAPAADVPAREAMLTPRDLITASEVFITSTTRELVPVVEIVYEGERSRIGEGRPGTVCLALLERYREQARSGAAQSAPAPLPLPVR